MSRQELKARILDLIEASPSTENLETLLADLRRYQGEHIEAYGRLQKARGEDAALPADVYRFARIATHSAAEDLRLFRTSGTTSGARGAHPFRDLDLYNAAAKAWAKTRLFPEGRLRLIVLAPNEEQLPDSSLSYMLSRFAEWFGTETTFCWNGGPDLQAFEEALHEAEQQKTPVAVLGTSFAYVAAEDAATKRFALPPKSRIMQTGGFKGKSREIPRDELRRLLSERYGVPEGAIVNEYGMTELSSQAYDVLEFGPVHQGGLRFPHWVKATAVDPETLEALPEGEVGLLRIDDAANLDSCCALLTADRARVIDGTIELLGRQSGATPRGCSLSVEEALNSPKQQDAE